MASSVPSGQRSLRAGLLLAGLLLTEGLVLSIGFDSARLREDLPGAWADAVSRVSTFLPVAIVAIFAWVLFGERLQSDRDSSGRPRESWSRVFFFLHVTAFGLLLLLSRVVFAGGLTTSQRPSLWIVSWLACAASVGALALLTVYPVASLRAVLRRAVKPVAVGLAVGGATYGLGELTGEAWVPLSHLTLATVHGMLETIGLDASVFPGQVVEVGSFSVEIAPVCSGSQGIGLMWGFLGAFFWIFRDVLRFPHVLALIPLGTAVIWFANAVRITVLVWIGARFSPDVAVEGFHSHAGWLLFTAVATLTLWATLRIPFFNRSRATVTSAGSQTDDSDVPTAAYLVPLLALIAASMITGALTAGFDWGYPVRIIACAAALFWAWRQIESLRPSALTFAIGVGAAVFGVALAMVEITGAGAAGAAVRSGFRELPTWGTVLWLVFRVVGSVLVVPVAEEVAFRGYLMRRFISVEFEQVDPRRVGWLAVLGSSLAFGLLHGEPITGTLAGVGFAVAYRRRGRLGDAILAHAAANALVAVWVLSTGDWQLWA